MSFFNLLLIFHIFSGCICLLTGGVAIFVRKRKGKHTLMGELYHAFFVIIFLTSSLMAFIHWSESAYLFYIGLFSYSFALFGYLAKKRKSKNWLGKHIGGMLGSYIAIITAVLVVNGHNIPLIKEIPLILIWILPTIIGTPLIFGIGRKYTRN